MISKITRKYRIYSRFLRTNIQNKFEYRLDFFLYMLAAIINPLLGLGIWLAASSSGAKLQLDNSQLTAYFIAVLYIGTLNQTWHAWFMAEDINLGNFSKYLLKPFAMSEEYFLMALTDKVFKLFFLSLLVIPAIIIFRIDFKSFFLDPQTLLFFSISLFFSVWIAFILESIIGLSAFWVQEVDFFKELSFIANQIFTGRVIPLAFYPLFLKDIIFLTPYRYVVSFPIELLMHKTIGNDLVYGFCIQFFWLLLLFSGHKFLYRNGVKRYQAYG